MKAFQTSALDVGEWSTSLPVRFIPGNGSRYAVGKWVGPRADLDFFLDVCYPLPGYKPLIVQSVA